MAVKEGYKHTEVGVIPEDWECIQLTSEYVDIYNGGTPSSSVKKYWNGEISWCTPTDITKTEGKYLSTTERSITDSGMKNSSAKLLPRGTLLLCSRATIGEIKIANIEITTNQGFKNIVTKDQLFNEFLYYYLLTQKRTLIDKAIGSTFLEISKKEVSNLHIAKPPLPEQKTIATALSDIDGLINSLSKLIDKKKKIKQGVMQELLTGKKRLDGFSGEWVETTLEELCYLVTKQTGFDYTKEIKPSLKNKKDVDSYPFIQNKDFEGRSINYNTDFYIPKDIAHKYPNILLNEKCLLISISGRIGNIGVFDSDQKAFIGGAVGIARFRDKSLIDWVLLYLQSKNGQNQIISMKKAGAQHNLTVYDVRKLMILVPQKKEAERVTQIIFDMDLEIETLQAKLDKYKAIKQGMMQELLTGRIRLLEGA